MPCYESITDLVDAGGVDVVDICTPTFLHRDNVMESLSLGKTTIVEKPCALTRADAEAMFALAEEKGVNLYVAQVLQFTREVEVLRKLVREGTYGRPLDAVFQRLSARPEWAQGGWLFDKLSLIHICTPSDSLSAGVAFIHQELSLINDLAIYENMFIGRELKTKYGLLDAKTMIQKTQEVFDLSLIHILALTASSSHSKQRAGPLCLRMAAATADCLITAPSGARLPLSTVMEPWSL